MFIMSGAQFSSAWILVFISVDRWIRTRFPFKSNRLCTPKKMLFAVFIMLLIDIGLHSHILTPIFGTLIPGFAIAACNANLKNVSYILFYFLDWTIVQVNSNKNSALFFKKLYCIDCFRLFTASSTYVEYINSYYSLSTFKKTSS